MAWVRKLPRICYSERITGKPKVIGCLVGTGRFELPTPRTPSECSTRLSHVPTRKEAADSPDAIIQRNPTAGFTVRFYTSARACDGKSANLACGSENAWLPSREATHFPFRDFRELLGAGLASSSSNTAN